MNHSDMVELKAYIELLNLFDVIKLNNGDVRTLHYVGDKGCSIFRSPANFEIYAYLFYNTIPSFGS